MAVDKTKLKKVISDLRKKKNTEGLQVDTDIGNLQTQLLELQALKSVIDQEKADLDAQEAEVDQLP
jgi:hypothetical protein